MTKTGSPETQVSDPDYPPYWSVKYLVAIASNDDDAARAAQQRLKELGFVIKPVAKNARAAV